jgi:Na+/melibiose symporter-like transporter
MKIEIDVEKTAKWASRHRPWILTGFLGFVLWRLASFVWYQPDNAWTQGQIIITTLSGLGLIVAFVISLIVASESR